MKKIDFHVHITPPDISANWRKYADREPYFSALSQSPKNKFTDGKGALDALDAAGFDKALVFGFGFRDMGLCRYVNDYVIEQTRLFPERFVGSMVVPPAAPALEAEIARCHDAGLRGVGELFPAGQDFEIGGKTDTMLLSGVCAERNLPVLVHANEPVGHEYAGKANISLRQFERFAENSPALKIVLAHWGGGLLFYETMPELRKKFANVYYDTAATPFLYEPGIYRAACALGLAEKIIFGSDFPLLPPARYLDGIAASGILPHERDLVLGGNAARVLGI